MINKPFDPEQQHVEIWDVLQELKETLQLRMNVVSRDTLQTSDTPAGEAGRQHRAELFLYLCGHVCSQSLPTD